MSKDWSNTETDCTLLRDFELASFRSLFHSRKKPGEKTRFFILAHDPVKIGYLKIHTNNLTLYGETAVIVVVDVASELRAQRTRVTRPTSANESGRLERP